MKFEAHWRTRAAQGRSKPMDYDKARGIVNRANEREQTRNHPSIKIFWWVEVAMGDCRLPPFHPGCTCLVVKDDDNFATD